MKIFSLKSKFALSFWTIVSGLSLNQITYYTSSGEYYELKTCLFCPPTGYKYGWPFIYKIAMRDVLNKDAYWEYYFLNLVFWILISFILLIIVKYFKNKNAQVIPQRNKIQS